MRPRPRLTVSQWADTYRMIPAGTSPESGSWRTSRAPYLRGIQDAVSDPSVNRVVVCAASQVGKSEFLLNVIGYYAHQEPSPILLVQADEQAGRVFSKRRIAGMFDATPALQGLLDGSARSVTNTIAEREFPGGYVALGWAGSATSLASRAIRIVLGDELDKWPASTGPDGDPWEQAIQRTANYFNRKIIAVSTPTTEADSRIARLFDNTDRCEYHVPCGRCGVLQTLLWPGIIYKREDGTKDLDAIWYKCAHCGGRIEEREKPAMLAAGEWQPGPRGHDEDPAPRGARGFHVSALLSPWVRWRDMAEQWITLSANRDTSARRTFVNLKLGEVWLEEHEKITVEALEKNREHYDAAVPEGVLMLVAAVDVQDNRLEVEVRGWGLGKESWGIEYQIIPGDTSTPAPWAQLDTLLQRSWSKADGRAYTLWRTFIDSGGHRTTEVYRWCYERTAREVYAIKGRAGPGLPIAGKPTINSLRAMLWPIGVDTGKEAVYSRLALPEPGPGYCHFPIGSGYDSEYFKGLVSEKRATKMRGGRRMTYWKPTRERNEPLDIAVYGTAAMESCAPDFADLAERDAKTKKPSSGGSSGGPKRRRYSSGIE